MAYNKSSMQGVLGDYANIRSIPAILSVVYIAASLYQFGGITEVDIVWLSYTLTTEHSVIASMGALLIAFMSSETKRFDSYENWEKVAIALGPAMVLGHQYTTQVTDLLTNLGDPLGFQLAFLATIIGWGVAVR